jgi:solute:Na+ symporter, SSS family
MPLRLVLLLLYSAALVAIGAWAARRARGPQDFFVAGRRLPGFLLFATLLAANIGAGSTVGAASYGYRDGLSGWWWNGSAGLGSLALAFWIGPRIWREARDRGYLTLGDFLEARYGRAVRGIVAILIWLGTLNILAAQLLGVASILTVVAGVPRTIGTAAGALLTVLYFVGGGLLSSAWVNLAQLVVLVAGFLVAVPRAVAAGGGLQALATAPGLPADYWNFWSGGQSGIALVALLGPAFVISPGLIQKVYGAVDEYAVRVGVGASAVALLLFAALPPLLGIVARVLHPGLASIDHALPTVLVRDLSPAVGTLALAAVFSAEISSADAVLFMLSTSFSQDIYRRFVRPGASDVETLRAARLAVVAAALAGVGVAVLFETVTAALRVFYSLLTVVLFVPVVAGLHSSRTGRIEAAASIAAGVGAMVLVLLISGPPGSHGWRPEMVGLAVAALGWTVTAMARQRSAAQ